jgi:type IV secretion system protein VirD4
MTYIRLLWRLFRLAVFELPILLIVVAAVYAVIRHVDADIVGTALTWIASGLAAASGIFCIVALLRQPADTYGSASFAKPSELRAAGLHGRGLILGKHDGAFMRFSKPGHLLTFAPTRSGKGVGAVIPTLLDHPGSVVVTDIKGENYRATSAYRGRIGKVIALAPFDRDIPSGCYNPMDFIRAGTAHDVDDARLLAEMMVASDGIEANHWEREARALITGLLLFIISELPREWRNLQELRALLMHGRTSFDSVLAKMAESSHPVVRRIADGFSQKEDRERSGVISTAQSRTEIFESSLLTTVTSSSTFRLEDLKNGVISLYLIVPPEYVGVYQPFLRLMVGLSTAAMTRNTRAPRHPVLFLLDELPALGYMRPVEDGIGYLAGYGATLWLFVQDLDQLQQTYRKWRSMIANCAVRQAFNVQDPETAKLLSAMLGQRTVRTRSEGHSGRFPWLALPYSFNAQNGETGRPLLAPDEVMLLPDCGQLLFVQGCKPVFAEKIRYFEEAVFHGRWTKRVVPTETIERTDLSLVPTFTA